MIKGIEIEDLSLEQIEVMITSGEIKNMDHSVQLYLDWMEMARDWYYKFKTKKFIIQHLVAVIKDKTGTKISQYTAEKIFADAINFFYANTNIRKEAWRNLYAERLELAAIVAWKAGDMDVFGRNIERAAKIRNLDQQEKEQPDPRLTDRKPIFYTLNPKDVGIEPADRVKLASMIDNLTMPEHEKEKLRQDAGISDAVFTENLSNNEQ